MELKLMPKNVKNFKANIKALMILNGYNNAKMADLIGLDVSNFSSKMNGKRYFQFVDIIKLLEIFDVTFEEIFLKNYVSKRHKKTSTRS